MASLIKKNVEITIDNNYASLNEPIYIYQNDRNIDIYITIKDVKYKFEQNQGNILVESSAKKSKIKVLKPNGKKFITDFLNLTQNGEIVLTITKDFADELSEIGVHRFQIQLFDEADGRVTIPYVTFEVLSPIFEDDDQIATVSCVRDKDE